MIVADHSNDRQTNSKCRSLGLKLIVSFEQKSERVSMIIADHFNDRGTNSKCRSLGLKLIVSSK